MSRVDYKLLAQRKISDYLDTINPSRLTERRFQDVLERLERMGPEVLPVVTTRLRRADREAAPMLARIVEELGTEAVVPSLLELMGDRRVPDHAKLILLNVLATFGVDVSQLPLNSYYADLQKAQEEADLSFIEALARDERILVPVVQTLAEQNPGARLEAVQSLAQHRDVRATPFLAIMARLPDPALQAVALEGLGRLGEGWNGAGLGSAADPSLAPDAPMKAAAPTNPVAPPEPVALVKAAPQSPDEFAGRRLAAFLELAEGGLTPDIRRHAAGYAEVLRRQGVAPHGPDVNELAGPIHDVAVSGVDGRGSRTVWVVRKHPRRRPAFTMVNILLNVEEGIRDVYGAFELTRPEVDETFASLSPAVPVVHGDAAYAGHLIRDALLAHRAAEGPVPPVALVAASGAPLGVTLGAPLPTAFHFWRDFLPPDWLVPRRYQPAPGPVPKPLADLGSPSRVNELMTLLLATPDLDDWFLDDPAVYDAVDQLDRLFKRAGGRRSEAARSESGPAAGRSQASRSAAMAQAEAVKRYLCERLVVPQRDRFLRRFELAVDFMRHRGETRMAQIAASCLGDLRSSRQLCRHPLVLALIGKSLQIAKGNMKEGFDPRLNPSAFE